MNPENDLIEYLKSNPEAPKIELSRRKFLNYLKYIAPSYKFGWWNKELCAKLQSFYDDLINGKRPVLIIQAPPQHGKSLIVMYFLTWLAGKNPDLKKIYASYSERLGIKTNLQIQRLMDGQKYKKIFPQTMLNASNVVTISGQNLRNREILEYVGKEGYFRNTTIRGQVTGESLDVGIIDDPLKGREEANSVTIREKTWEWFTDDFLSRFSDKAGLLIILTRWHVDDPVGRLLDMIDDIAELGDNVQVYSRPALIEHESDLKDSDPRSVGEALFPEHKSEEFLMLRKKLMTSSSWESLYQQRPFVKGGGMFAIEHFKIVDAAPQLKGFPVRYWDKAGSEDSGAYTAGVLMSETVDGQYIVMDVKRKQLSPMNRENLIKQTAILDEKKTRIWIEQEPGSAGKESAENTIRNNAGFSVKADRVTGSKEERAEPYAAQVEAGNVLLLKAPWNKDFIDEHELFPNGKYKDQVDAAAGAFTKITNHKLLGFTQEQKKAISKKVKKSGDTRQW